MVSLRIYALEVFRKGCFQNGLVRLVGFGDVHYGHKLNLTSGKSGMILDVVIEAGNPADAERLLPMLKRHIDMGRRAERNGIPS